MPYYGGGGTGTGGGTNDHRLLAGRSDANQHPATAVSVNAATLQGVIGDAGTVQAALEMLARRSGVEEIRPVAAAAVGAYRAVAYRPDDRVEAADHATPEHAGRLAGLTLATASAGAEARVAADGPVRFDGWNWTPGLPVFVGRNGELTQSPPASGFVQHVGFAVGRDAVLVQIERPIQRS